MRRLLPVLLLALPWAAACSAPGAQDPAGHTAAKEHAAAIVQAVSEVVDNDSTGTKEDLRADGIDTVAVRSVQFDAAAIHQLQADPQYDYDRELHVEMLWWERIKNWLGRWLRELFGSKAGSWVFSNLHWGILIGAVIFLLFFLRKRLFHGVFTPEAEKARQVTEVEENIQQLDLDHLLAKAEHSGDWRSALRFQYLKVLRRLMDDGSIEFQPRSTDRDYLRQLRDPAERAHFGELSFLFKWAWYGDAPMDEARYRKLAPTFSSFHTPIRQAP
ncbi:MAG: DUF4129 domain-containing protein [Flavobacteriales bacterium]|nr:DUF4129 domain-containing protein [Flavobacteriales bacterium]MCB0759184.1 DUF4129 domain-containing protein [Flavobacteriales bacterium]